MRTANRIYTWIMQLAVKIRPSRTAQKAWAQLEPELNRVIESGVHPLYAIAFAEWAVKKADYKTTWPVDLFRSKIAEIYGDLG